MGSRTAGQTSFVPPPPHQQKPIFPFGHSDPLSPSSLFSVSPPLLPSETKPTTLSLSLSLSVLVRPLPLLFLLSRRRGGGGGGGNRGGGGKRLANGWVSLCLGGGGEESKTMRNGWVGGIGGGSRQTGKQRRIEIHVKLQLLFLSKTAISVEFAWLNFAMVFFLRSSEMQEWNEIELANSLGVREPPVLWPFIKWKLDQLCSAFVDYQK